MRFFPTNVSQNTGTKFCAEKEFSNFTRKLFCNCTASLVVFTHVFRLKIDFHGNFFNAKERKAHSKTETLISHTLTGTRNKNDHEDKNEQLFDW